MPDNSVGWCFTVQWHRLPSTKRAVHRDSSLNLFEADLADFEALTGPLSLPPPHKDHDELGLQWLTATDLVLYRQ
jgi:hypothetical protein